MKILIIFLLFPLGILGQEKQVLTLDNYMQAQTNFNEFSGAVLVIKKGSIIYEKAFGKADREWNIKNTTDTKFRIGSNTKQFTAACIMKLEEQGRLSINDKVSKYIPDYPKGDSVTIHMLLNHTSGITDYTNLDEFWNSIAYLPLKPDSFITLFKNKPYDFSPGSKWNYSNSNYYLLGIIIEKISGNTYSDYLNKNIIIPAALKNTNVDRLDSVLLYRAKGYAKLKTFYYNAPYISMESPWSSGAIYSTVEDLYKWSNALFNNKVVTAFSLKKMTTPYKETYGYGLFIDSLNNHLRIWHDGGIPGFSSHLAYYPADDVNIIALSNNSFNTNNIGNGLAHLLFNIPIEIPYFHKEIPLADSLLTKYAGKYNAASAFEIIKKNGKLYRHRSKGRDIELKPESKTKFFYADDSDRQLEFKLTKDNIISNVFIIISGIKTEIKKME